jgi:DeoR/GlpR family transcriptional regulator of sugar metabolism
MTVNRKRKFTVKELSQEFGVSQRTILRDLQELSELCQDRAKKFLSSNRQIHKNDE